jgi:elongation factor G
VEPLVVQHPIGREGGFTGVVDLARMRAVSWVDGARHERPAEGADVVAARHRLEEAVAERHPVALAELGAMSERTLRRALRDLTAAREAVVVLCGSAYRNRGVEPLLDAVVDYLPAPGGDPAPAGTQGAVLGDLARPGDHGRGAFTSRPAGYRRAA